MGVVSECGYTRRWVCLVGGICVVSECGYTRRWVWLECISGCCCNDY